MLTRTLHASGLAEVSDFMPVAEVHRPGHTIVRRAKCARGAVTFDVVCAPRFDYGRTQHSVEAHPGEVIFTSRDRDRTALRLRAEVPCVVADGAAHARFTLRAGQTAAFVLKPADPAATRRSTSPDFVSCSFADTVNFWRTWVGQSNCAGRWRESVHGERRAALAIR